MNIQEINYSSAYSFADYTLLAIRDPAIFDYSEDIAGDFFDFQSNQFYERIAYPQKYTILHNFIYNVNNFPIQHYLNKIEADSIIRDYGKILDDANIIRPDWFNIESVGDNLSDLATILDEAVCIITEATFQLLFANRTFLFEFNQFLQPYIAKLQPDDHGCIQSAGRIKRSYFPVWLKNAIFYRDKGRCQICGCDLTNILVPTKQRHIDHMVPLKNSGTNDPTNFQLLCEACNKSKGANVYATDHLSYKFW